MTRFRSILCLSLLSLLPTLVLADDRVLSPAVAVCEASLSPMREAMATMRQGGTLSQAQESLWRGWNQQCRHASWQRALAEGLPPVPDYPTQPLPPPEPTWRDYVYYGLKGLERGLTAPVYVCTTRHGMTLCGPR